ncbi:dipeptidase [Glacieibacterium frigidum]|nr:membrane dipeptidase [Glacieibacterium frigidum]
MITTRRQILAGAAGLTASAAFAAPFDPRAYDTAIVIDGLGAFNDPDGKESDGFNLSVRAVEELRASGLTAVQQTIGEVGNTPGGWESTVASIAFFNRLVAANPQVLSVARTAGDIRAAKAARRMAFIYGTQDTAMVGPTLDRIDTMAGLGIRVVQLTYNLRNLSGDGALEAADAGLSKLGRTTIERIEAAKLLLDLSHGGARTIADAIAHAKRPPTISHTGCRALHDHPRNVGDASLKAVAAKGGVVGIYWMPFLVAGGKPMAADLIRHLNHAVNVCGEDHVGIGTDGILSKTVIDAAARKRQAEAYASRSAAGYAAPGEGPDIFTIIPDLDSHLRFRLFADALSNAGWSSARIEKILGANLLRLYGEVWG